MGRWAHLSRNLVTGGTGFTGSHLVRHLAEDGEDVRVIARSPEKASRLLPPQVDVVTGDLTDRETVCRAMNGIRTVYHIAAAFREPGIPDERYREVNVDATRYLLEAAREAGVERFVHCSTVGVLSHVENPPADETYPHTPGDVYQETKSQAELLALDFHRREGLPVAVGRPVAIYGPGDMRLYKLFDMIARRRFVMIGDGEIFYHMVYVSDLVRGFRLLAEHPNAVGEVFILGGERYHTLNEIVARIAKLVGAPEPRLKLPARPFQLLGSAVEKVCVPLGIEPPIYRRRVDFFTKSRAFSIEKAKRLLGYVPQVPLETGLARTAEWYRAEGLLPARS